MSSLRASKSSSFFSGRSTSIGARSYMNPTEKRMNYIADFLTKLRQSDPDFKVFSQAELVQVAQELRENCNSDPWLFDIVRRVVDGGVFLDQNILARVDEMNGAADQITVEDVAQARQKLELQTEMKRLYRFTEDYLNSNYSSSKTITMQSLLTEYFLTKEQIDQFYTSHFGSRGSEEDREVFQTMAIQLKPLLSEVITQMHRAWNCFRESLELKCNELSIAYFELNNENEEDSKSEDISSFIEKDQQLVKCCIQTESLLRNSVNLLTKLDQLMNHYQQFVQTRDDLQRLRAMVHELGLKVTTWDVVDTGSNSNQIYDRAIEFLDSNRDSLRFDSLIGKLQSITTSLVVSEKKLELLSNNF